MSFIGLTGGFGMGKTTVLRLFKNSGAYTISADKLVHSLLKKPVIIKKLVAILGENILIRTPSKVSINKKRMADIIFKSTRKRRSVEKIIHPEVIKTAQNIKTEILNKNRKAIIIFEVPLLFERGYKEIFDKIIVVYCNKSTALNRLAQRGLSKEQAIKRMRVQIPISAKKTNADFLINNNSNMSNTKTQVKVILNKLGQKK